MFNSTYGTLYYVDDMSKTVAFYKKLGFKAAQESADWTEFDLGGVKLCFHSKNAGETYPPGGIMIMNSTGLKSLQEKMAADKLKVTKLKEIYPGHYSFDLTDENSNRVSFFGPA